MTRRLPLFLLLAAFVCPALAGEEDEAKKRAEIERALAVQVEALERAAAVAKAAAAEAKAKAAAEEKKKAAAKAAAEKEAAEKAKKDAGKKKPVAAPVLAPGVRLLPGVRFVRGGLRVIPAAPAKPGNAAKKEGDAAPASVSSAEPVIEEDPRHEVRLKSGTVLVGKLEPARWTIQTPFGPLVVPVADMKIVRFGRLSDPEKIKSIREAIAALASEHPEERARATARLKAAGVFAAGDLKKAAKEHEDPEVKRTCKELLDGMKLKDNQITPDEDRIETTTFPIRGQVGPDSFKVTVDELGALNIRRSDILLIRLYKKSRVVKVKISGKNMWPNGWLDTKIKLKKGEKFRIMATGKIRFPNWGNRTFTPDGHYQWGNINGIANGSLGARITGGGRQFKAGSSYTGKADRDGNLQLCLMANMRGQPTDGEYTVSIERLMD